MLVKVREHSLGVCFRGCSWDFLSRGFASCSQHGQESCRGPLLELLSAGLDRHCRLVVLVVVVRLNQLPAKRVALVIQHPLHLGQLVRRELELAVLPEELLHAARLCRCRSLPVLERVGKHAEQPLPGYPVRRLVKVKLHHGVRRENLRVEHPVRRLGIRVEHLVTPLPRQEPAEHGQLDVVGRVLNQSWHEQLEVAQAFVRSRRPGVVAKSSAQEVVDRLAVLRLVLGLEQASHLGERPLEGLHTRRLLLVACIASVVVGHHALHHGFHVHVRHILVFIRKRWDWQDTGHSIGHTLVRPFIAVIQSRTELDLCQGTPLEVLSGRPHVNINTQQSSGRSELFAWNLGCIMHGCNCFNQIVQEVDVLRPHGGTRPICNKLPQPVKKHRSSH
mmetsp:Transcript_15456/g.36509  ORF Transcript_15456/g.36509 Transcript_15456/m.36509 type:complete len:390 (-) Transcript_15456:513-1682(-)